MIDMLFVFLWLYPAVAISDAAFEIFGILELHVPLLFALKLFLSNLSM